MPACSTGHFLASAATGSVEPCHVPEIGVGVSVSDGKGAAVWAERKAEGALAAAVMQDGDEFAAGQVPQRDARACVLGVVGRGSQGGPVRAERDVADG